MRIKPFKGIRPIKDLVEKIAINPNNLLNEDERREVAKKNPFSFAHVIKPKIDFNENISKTDDKLFAHAKKYFQKLIDEKSLEQDEHDCFYVYMQMLNGRVQTGVVCCYNVKEYDEGRIKKHEHIRPEKLEENVKHMLATGISSNPIFLAYNPVSEIDTMINEEKGTEPDYHFTSDSDVTHSLWVVNDEEQVLKMQKLFNEKVPVTYIADGHHRAASTSDYAKLMREKNPGVGENAPFNYMLTCLFPSNQLKIYDYNRLVKDLNGMKRDEFINAVKEKFEVNEAEEKDFSTEQLHHFGMYLDNKWYSLVAKENSFPNDPVGSLDVSILQNNLLAPILGIKDPRTDKRIDFMAGVKGLSSMEKRVNKKKAAVAFALYPCTMEQLFAVADAGEVMPPKSTWFEPKLLSGLVIYKV